MRTLSIFLGSTLLGMGFISTWAADTTLVTRLEYQDTTGKVLSANTFRYERGDSGGYVQHQYLGTGAEAKPTAIQKFNARSQVVHAITLDSLGKTATVSDWKYNDKGKLIQFNFDQGAGSALQIDYALLTNGEFDSAISSNNVGKVTSVLRYAYDSNGRVAEEKERHGDSLYLVNKHHWANDGLKDTVFTLSGGIDTVQLRFFEYDSNKHPLIERVRIKSGNGTYFQRETRTTWSGDQLLQEDQYDGSGHWLGRIAHIWGPVTFEVVALIDTKAHRKSPFKTRKSIDVKGREILPTGFPRAFINIIIP